MVDTTMEQRLTRMAERLAVVESKTQTIDHAMPRISQLETSVATLGVNITDMRGDIGELRENGTLMISGLAELTKQHGGISSRISQLFWTGAGVVLLATAIGGGISLYETWLDIQDKRHRNVAMDRMEDRQLTIESKVDSVKKDVKP
jgi:hypothetical protein